MKSTVFAKELSYIKNEDNRNNVVKLLELLPDYFYEIPASSTGKYHPSFTLGDGGLVRHTKVAVRIAFELLSNNSIGYTFNNQEKDLIIIALLVHDGLKKGEDNQEFTLFEHPLLIGKFIREHASNLTLNKEDLELLISMVEAHMGEWNTNKYSTYELPLPKNKYQRFVHMCDYLSSKKFLDVKFNNFDIND
jgi:hypothetical protein